MGFSGIWKSWAGEPGELGAPRSRWDSIVFIGFQYFLIHFYRFSMILNEIVKIFYDFDSNSMDFQ